MGLPSRYTKEAKQPKKTALLLNKILPYII